MVRMEMDCDMEFRKSFSMSVFQRFKFGSQIVENVAKMLLQCVLSSRNCF